MAALSGITAVRPTINTIFASNPIWGETVAVGESVYQDTVTAKWFKGDSNASATTAAAKGIAMTPGVADGYGVVATGGNVILVGATVAVGMLYCVGATPGTIVPYTDLTTGDYVTLLGAGATSTQLNMLVNAFGVAKP